MTVGDIPKLIDHDGARGPIPGCDCDRCVPRYFDKLCADRLADEVAVLVRRKVIDARSPAADALLDYRDPPPSPRADRMAELETTIGAVQVALDAARPGNGHITDRARRVVANLARVQQQHDILINLGERREQDHATLRAEHDALRTKLERITEEQLDCEATNAEINAENDRLRRELADAKAQLTVVQDALAELQGRAAAANGNHGGGH